MRYVLTNYGVKKWRNQSILGLTRYKTKLDREFYLIVEVL